MSQGLELLDEALSLAREEKNALEGGAYEQAIEISQKRGEITGMACNLIDMSDREPYQKRLLELSSLQEQLTEIASRAHAAVKERLCRSRMEKKRIRGYHLAVEQALQ